MRSGRPRLGRRVIVLTEAVNAIGMATARCLAGRGARLVLAAQDGVALHTLTEELRSTGGRVTAVVADVGWDEDVAETAAAATDHYGGFDTWINNPAVPALEPVGAAPVEELHRIFDRVYWGAVAGSREAERHFRQRHTAGSVINVGNFYVSGATPLQSTHASASAAVRSFTTGLRREMAAQNLPVAVTLVTPGLEGTGLLPRYLRRRTLRGGMLGTPDAIAEAIARAVTHPKPEIRTEGFRPAGGSRPIAGLRGHLRPAHVG